MIAPAVVLCMAMSAPIPPEPAVQDSSRASTHSVPFRALFHHRHGARRTRRAVADSTTPLQVQVGYDGDFRAPDLRRDEASTLSLIVTPRGGLELQADMDVRASQQAPSVHAVRGRGDAHLAVQWTAHTTRTGALAFALAYEVKLPTATPRDLTTGRVDHRALVPVSLVIRRWQIDLTPGVDAIGRPQGVHWGIEGAAAITTPLVGRLAAHVELSGQTVDTDQPAGRYASVGASWQFAPTIDVDLGARIGLSDGAPAYGLTAGITAAFGGR